MKVGVIIIVFNLDCRVFLLQISAIRKFCSDDYVIEVIDNSTDIEKSEAIKYHAGSQNVNYRKTEPNNNDPSHSHAFAANISYKILQNEYDILFYLDHDCIPVKSFNCVEILGKNDIAGVQSGQGQTKYFWPGCLMWKVKKIPKSYINFNPVHRLRADTGGGLYKILPRYKCLFFDEVGCANPDFSHDPDYYFYMTMHNKTFIHWLNTSNWRNKKNNEERINTLINITQNLIDGNFV